jgi:glycosyltransferase involved in cell wall biosynthesis
VLDTEDLHFLRQARQDGLDVNRPRQENLFGDKAKREVASILRSDLSLIISEYEHQLLTDQFGVSAEQLLYLPPYVSYHGPGQGFDQRKDLVMVGNLKHAPNVDAVSYFRNDLWPSIKSAIPAAEVKVYGAYAPENIRQLHSDREGFHIMGWTADVGAELAKARLNICAVRYGAGLKIKLLDAMAVGTPSVSTQVGAEGIAGSLEFPGSIARDQQEFIDEVVRLYTREAEWNALAGACQSLLESRFSKEEHHDRLLGRVDDLSSRVVEHRRRNFIIEVLQHQSLQSTKYLSKWITAKNRPSSK